MGLFKKKEEAPTKEPKTEGIKHGECFENVCPKITGITDIVKSLKACKTVKELDEAYMEGMKGMGIMVGYLAAVIDAQREMVDCYNEIDTMHTNDSTAFFKSNVQLLTGVMCGTLEPQRMGAQTYINFYNRDVEPLYEHLRKALVLDEFVKSREAVHNKEDVEKLTKENDSLKEKISELEAELAKKDDKEANE